MEMKDFIAKFKLGDWPINYQGVLERSISVKWWNPYDLLGLFISILGPAPGTANRNNYFKPLIAVYARWCSRIAGYASKWKPPGDGAGFWPFMFQATWKPVGDKKYFFLGGSIAGDNWDPNEVGQWKQEVQRQRFYMFHDSLMRVDIFNRDSFDKPPVKLDTYRLPNHSFGNCGETYPFIFNIRSTRSDNRTLEGLALCRDFMMSQSLDSYDKYLEAKKNRLCGPCGNSSLTAKKPQGITVERKEAIATHMAAITDPPEGWSINVDDLDRDYYWGPDGDGTRAAQQVGLTGMKELMVVEPDSGGDSYMFTASTGKIYLCSWLGAKVLFNNNGIIYFNLPSPLVELLALVLFYLANRDIKNLRLTGAFFRDTAHVCLTRVFLPANPLNISIFRAIIDHEILCRGVREIIWDDTRLASRDDYFDSGFGEDFEADDKIPF
ncbi:hypothetical protein GL218_07123 [Daldinia childiae]|uniref:uncharacterized protein n=1 Tax=Daldinia childiae TaxID=326645 RepID=UPI001445C86F|nr:uncharacterized protein GL218_07123 [Daldinia childiae]KAF3055928.1 hypothetical protein GL218_07123 [Daldinia childiae]